MNIASLPLYPCEATGLQVSKKHALRAVHDRSESRGLSGRFQDTSAHMRAIVDLFSRKCHGQSENHQGARVADRMFVSRRSA